MEQAAIVDVFERGDKKRFYLTVEPRVAIEGVKRHLAAQQEEVELFDPIAGDVGVNLLNGKSIEDVLKGAARIANTYPAVSPAQADIQL